LAWLSVACARLAVVTTGAELTVIVSDLPGEPTPLASVATTVKVCVVAETLTVPEIRPVEDARDRPAGSDPDEILQPIVPVPPLETSVCE